MTTTDRRSDLDGAADGDAKGARRDDATANNDSESGTADVDTDTDTDTAVADARDTLASLTRRFAGHAARPTGEGVGVIEESGDRLAEHRAVAGEVQAALFDAGLACPEEAPEFGGRGLPSDAARQVRAMVDAADLPTRNMLFVGLNIVAPAIRAFGTPEQRERFLPGLLSGATVGCQLFSEPSAGSDLASVRTRARRDGDDWVLTGQKVWTSHAQIADWGEALVRTDPNHGRHRGLSVFLVDMSAPGVRVRPLRQMTGGAAFNEVFLDEVRVPDACRIGPAGDGWRVALTSLGSERGAMGGGDGPLSARVLGRFVELLSQHRVADNPALRARLGRTVSAVHVQQAAMRRPDTSWPAALAPVTGSIQKLLLNRALDAVGALVTEVLGNAEFVDTGTRNSYAWSEFALGVPALHLAGGTDDIQRGLIAHRGLGLPRG
ncbi:acyl-CoA dehydrogenase family protein [Gordonia sinesedis]